MTKKKRNISCRYYKKCLTRAVKEKTDFDCAQCEHLHDEDLYEEVNLESYYLLFYAIFKPEYYKKYRRLEAARAQLKRYSETGCANDATQS